MDCLQTCAGTFQPGNLTGCGSEGVKSCGLWTVFETLPSQLMTHKSGPSSCGSHAGGDTDSVALGIVYLSPHLLVSRSPPVPLRRQLGVKQI